MNAAEQKVVQYLDEAHATEQALVRVLQSQIAMAPEGSYRSGLESHLDETRDHAVRVRARLKALGQGSNPLMGLVGLAETVLGQALAVGKAPFDLLRGSGGEEKVLKNAKDACASESLEIATYSAIERLARSVGDDETAELAASIRADEEKMLEGLLGEIPKLTEAVARAGVEGEPLDDVTGTTAATKRTGRRTPKPKAAARAKRQNGGGKPTSGVPAGANAADAVRDAKKELEAAADAGDGAAAFTLSEQLRDTDNAEAERWLGRAADLGDVRAAYRLGMLHWERRDIGAAEAALRNATADSQGAHALGRLLWQERSDLPAAVQWLDRAAQADNPAAERDLGIVLREGGDLHGAHWWLSRAAERDGAARQALAALESR